MADHQRFYVTEFEGLAQQRVVVEVDLPDREIVGRPPIGVYQATFLRIEGRLTLREGDGVGFKFQILWG